MILIFSELSFLPSRSTLCHYAESRREKKVKLNLKLQKPPVRELRPSELHLLSEASCKASLKVSRAVDLFAIQFPRTSTTRIISRALKVDFLPGEKSFPL
jgi:hypothetical protein